MTEGGRLQGKKIIFVFGDLELGGAERQGLLLAEGLKSRYGAEVQIWGLSGKPGKLSDLCDRKGIAWRSVKCGWGKYSLTRIAKVARFAAALRKERPDLILAYTRLPNLVCGLAWRLSGASAMVWNQRDEGLLLEGSFWERLSVGLASCYLCNSDMGSWFLRRLYQVPSESVAVIRNGVTLPAPLLSAEKWRERLRVEKDVPLACMVANITRYKDHETLLRAWARVEVPDRPLPVLVLAGRVDEGGDELNALAERLGIHSRVIMAGKVDDISGLLGAVDLCVHSSRSEGLSNSVLEAMATGVPIVGTDIPGIREAVGPDGEAFLAPAGDADALAAHISKLLTDGDVRRRLGARMRLRTEVEFSPEMMVTATASLLSGL